MVIGEKLWEGKGKSEGPGMIKSIGAEGIKSIYSWSAEMKGMGKAKNLDGNIHVTAKMKSPPKGTAGSKDQEIFMLKTGDMCVVKGFDLMKMAMGSNPTAVGLWSFMTMSEKFDVDGIKNNNVRMEVRLKELILWRKNIGRCLIGGAETKDPSAIGFTLRICAR